MHRKYDLFEKFPDGSSLWRACVLGLDGTRRHLKELAQKSENHFYAMEIASGKIVHDNFALDGFKHHTHRKNSDRGKSAMA
jgi:hypothetical protein